MPHCVPCTQEHIEQLKPRIRESDQMELRLSSDRAPSESLQLSFDLSKETFAVIKDDVVLCVFGVCPHLHHADIGIPWLICAEEFVSVAGRRFAFQCRKYIRQMLDVYPILVNCVWKEHTVAIKWLRWCGFEFHPEIKWGPNGSPFYPFSMKRKKEDV